MRPLDVAEPRVEQHLAPQRPRRRLVLPPEAGHRRGGDAVDRLDRLVDLRQVERPREVDVREGEQLADRVGGALADRLGGWLCSTTSSTAMSTATGTRIADEDRRADHPARLEVGDEPPLELVGRGA